MGLAALNIEASGLNKRIRGRAGPGGSARLGVSRGERDCGISSLSEGCWDGGRGVEWGRASQIPGVHCSEVTDVGKVRSPLDSRSDVGGAPVGPMEEVYDGHQQVRDASSCAE